MDWLTVIIGWLNPMEWVKGLVGYFRRAKLCLYFDPQSTYHKRLIVDRGNALGIFCHLMVRNEGKQTARNCRARLIFVKHKDSSGQFVLHPDFVNPVILKWAHETDFDSKDVEAGLPRRLDLCYVIESLPNILNFFTLPIPNGIRKEFPPGIYQVKIRIDSENAGSVSGEFLIDFTKNWDKITIEAQKGEKKVFFRLNPLEVFFKKYHSLKIRPAITASLITGFCVILAALIGIWGRGFQFGSAKQFLEVKNSPGSRNLQAGRDYIESQQIYVSQQIGLSLPSADQITALGRRALWTSEYLGSRGAYLQLLDWRNSINDQAIHKLLSDEIKRVEDDYRVDIMRGNIDGWSLICKPHVDCRDGFENPTGFSARNVIGHLDPQRRMDERARAACILRNIKTAPDKNSVDKKVLYESLIRLMGPDESSLCVSKMALETYNDLTGFSSKGIFDFDGVAKDWEERKDEILKKSF
jgi:hypothetical protein